MSLFYRQPGIECPQLPPLLPIPGSEDSVSRSSAAALDGGSLLPSLIMPSYMGQTFPQLCRFWRIMHEVVIVYYGNDALPLGTHVDPVFAEFKFRELLAWASSLPSSFTLNDNSPHHVLILR